MRRLGLPAAALSLALGAAQVAAAVPSQAAASSGRVAVGHAPALPKGAVSAAAPSATKKLSLDIELNSGHAAELSAYAAGVGNRNSPYYHQYLTPSQVAEYFGASSTEIAAVQSALKAEGLTVGSVSADGMFLPVSGTVAQVQHAFSVTIAGYRAAGRNFYANTAAPTVPATVVDDLSNIVGLDDIAYAHPNYTAAGHIAKAGAASTSKVTPRVGSGYTVGTCSNIDSVFSGSGLSNGDGYYTDDAVSNIYGLSPLLTAGNDGSGVTVAVFELENYDPTGVSDLDSCYGHSSTSVSEVKVDGGPTAPANMYNNIGVESALDIENIANLAPGASIIDYAGPDDASDTDVLNTYETIFDQDKAQVVSSSWGICEPVSQADSSSMQVSESALFEQAAVQGQTVVAASGDAGSTDCYSEGVAADNSILAVDDPASQPYVTGVGGTTMTGLSDPAQSVWNEACQTIGKVVYCGAGGGGVSNYWSQPSYQSGVAGSGYTAKCAKASSTGCRQVPDVSALADSNEGYVIDEYYDDGVGDTGYYYNVVGGTSGAAPVWAAIFALADASSTCQSNGGAGFVNPSLYAAGKAKTSSVFTDITSGNNKIAGYGATYGYSAASGYDMDSGWGTPDAAGVLSTVCQGSVVSPASYYEPDGPVRLLDTRKATLVGTVTGPIASKGTVKVQITGKNGVPTSGVTAAILNVTVTGPTAGGNATVYPDGTNLPLSSNLNWVKGGTEPNLVVVPVGSDGKVDIWNGSPGTVQFIADLEGYFTSSASASGVSSYTPVGPVRAMDTRAGTGVARAKLAEHGIDSLQVGGTTITPTTGSAVTIPSGITGIAMNVTVTNVTGSGYLAVYPNENSAGTAVATPNVSNLNFSPGSTVPNMVIIPVGADGKVDFYNGALSGSTDVIADIAGYYTAGTSGAKYHPLGPVRLVDTRYGQGESSAAPIGTKGTLTLPLPSSYSAIIANLTVVSPKAGGFLSAYPAGGNQPNVSNLNFGTGETIPNLAIVPSSNGVTFYNNATGSLQLVVDLAGYFSAS